LLQSGISVKNREKLALAIGYLLGNIGSVITIKNEFKEQRINGLINEILEKLAEIRAGNAQLAAIKQKIADELTALAALQAKNGQYGEYVRMLNEINAELTANIAKFNNLSNSDETVVSDLLILCEGLKENISKFSKTQSYLELLIEKAIATSTSTSSTTLIASSSAEAQSLHQSNSESNSDYYKIEGIDDINKSSIITFDSTLT